jgi:hypothetical protein
MGIRIPNSRIYQVQKTPVLIHQTMPFTCGFCSAYRSLIRITLVVFACIVLPLTELILILDVDFAHGITQGWFL